MEYGTLLAQSSHLFPNLFLSAVSSFDILGSTKMMSNMWRALKYIATSNLPSVVFHSPDSMIQVPLPRCQGNHPTDSKIMPV